MKRLRYLSALIAACALLLAACGATSGVVSVMPRPARPLRAAL
jgi:hypothetical protein